MAFTTSNPISSPDVNLGANLIRPIDSEKSMETGTTLLPKSAPSSHSNQSHSPTSAANNNILSAMLAESSHPTALLFHFGFRTAALFTYLFSGWFLPSSSFVFTVVLAVTLLAMDFWTVKNVTGRLLVGRRWWNATALDGSTAWTFEARPAPWRPNPSDSRLFWSSLYGFTVIWALLGVVAVLRFNFSWLLVVAFALTLNITNLLGYLKCDREAQSQMISNWGNSIVTGWAGNRLNSLFTGAGSKDTTGANNV